MAGGTLLACILGPWAGALVVTSILLIQALVFQDGGILALGANVINMALLGVVADYLPAKLLSRDKWKIHGLFIDGFCSVMMSGLLALTELTSIRRSHAPGVVRSFVRLIRDQRHNRRRHYSIGSAQH